MRHASGSEEKKILNPPSISALIKDKYIFLTAGNNFKKFIN